MVKKKPTKVQPVPKPKKKVKAPKSKAKSERKKLMDECFKLASLCARTRDRECKNCKSDTYLQAHHIVSRRHGATCFDLDNLITLCRSCHFKQKVSPQDFYRMIVKIVPDEEEQRLVTKSKVTLKWTLPLLRDEIEKKKSELKRIEGDYGRLK